MQKLFETIRKGLDAGKRVAVDGITRQEAENILTQIRARGYDAYLKEDYLPADVSVLEGKTQDLVQFTPSVFNGYIFYLKKGTKK